MTQEFFASVCQPDEQTQLDAYARQAILTKPQGALGLLEEIAVRLAGMQGTANPQIKQPWVSVFAADHGIAATGVSAFPQVVTQEMVKNFCRGGAAINVLACFAHANFEVVDVGVIQDVAPLAHLVSARVAAGTQNFLEQPAMSQAQLLQALQVGADAVNRAKQSGADLFICGEMGIGNTTAASAITAVLSGQSVSALVGEGTGIGFRQKKQKVQSIEQAIELHQAHLTSPLRVLQYLGGFEIAAMTGAYLRGAQLGMPMVVDGVIASVAVWVADFIARNDQLAGCTSVEQMMELGKYSLPETLFCTCGSLPRITEWCFFAHQSVEPAHAVILEALGVTPMLNFEMRLGEASGAALVIPLLQQACALHNQMATFEQAEVSGAH
ncbi:nicotinate-nucleotide--dimethylbenzimidazole phosphoribosyltransferase [Thiosulfatimonas sediminis]|uniref:Nicotinate-nucleotide--dimethylbenzimidazole phosphoribosyltransferase n=1 Tax=Thiosulfatimonas sediminis TaxID=2675054 RepID=A0A6F8PVJ2_9GAMM|nr:nicotinate-nucleotide--dimethylbenzimidazole phosphoribosyltransferase [Thiosulfatimonas sediminis]BBP46116.1 nicotinate-nucleotide--dimethylbenzimidazole phosphoribosyltransferase [Thiosulfatimonas sediminis]